MECKKVANSPLEIRVRAPSFDSSNVIRIFGRFSNKILAPWFSGDRCPFADPSGSALTEFYGLPIVLYTYFSNNAWACLMTSRPLKQDLKPSEFFDFFNQRLSLLRLFFMKHKSIRKRWCNKLLLLRRFVVVDFLGNILDIRLVRSRLRLGLEIGRYKFCFLVMQNRRLYEQDSTIAAFVVIFSNFVSCCH